MRVITIVVTYNGEQWIEKCLTSLENSHLYTEVLIVDNGSSDQTLSIVRDYFPSTKLIENQTNLGFGQANNLGIAYALREGADYVFLLNQDAWIESNTLQALVDAMTSNTRIGVASPLHRNGSNSGWDTNFKGYLMKEDNPALNSFLNKGHPLEEIFYKVNFVNAAAWLLSRRCIENVGGFDPLFYHYGEDKDYLVRVRYHGFDVGIFPGAFIYHDRENRTNRKIVPAKDIIKRRYRSMLINLKNPDEDFELRWKLKIKTLVSELYHGFFKEGVVIIKLLILLLKERNKIRKHWRLSKIKGRSFLEL